MAISVREHYLNDVARENSKPLPCAEPTEHIDIVFDGPPSHESGRFVEVENAKGESIRFGEWVQREDGYWALRLKKHDCSWLDR